MLCKVPNVMWIPCSALPIPANGHTVLSRLANLRLGGSDAIYALSSIYLRWLAPSDATYTRNSSRKASL